MRVDEAAVVHRRVRRALAVLLERDGFNNVYCSPAQDGVKADILFKPNGYKLVANLGIILKYICAHILLHK